MDVKYAAELARIKLTAEEAQELQGQLEIILSFFKDLESLATENVEPLSQVLDVKNVFRQDLPKKSLDKQEILKLAPRKNGDFIKIPRAIGL